VLAAQFESSAIAHHHAQRALAVSGALALSALVSRLSLNIYTKVGLITWSSRYQARHPHHAVRQQLQREGKTRRAAVEEPPACASVRFS